MCECVFECVFSFVSVFMYVCVSVCLSVCFRLYVFSCMCVCVCRPQRDQSQSSSFRKPHSRETGKHTFQPLSKKFQTNFIISIQLILVPCCSLILFLGYERVREHQTTQHNTTQHTTHNTQHTSSSSSVSEISASDWDRWQ